MRSTRRWPGPRYRPRPGRPGRLGRLPWSNQSRGCRRCSQRFCATWSKWFYASCLVSSSSRDGCACKAASDTDPRCLEMR